MTEPRSEQPLVSIITPVYNGENYLSDCIDSVLSQTYRHWEYIIVNNCSTDGTSEIIARHAKQDPRIRVHNNDQFVNVIQNHNIAFEQISPHGKYCKLIHADDLLFPTCIEDMVEAAESSPSVGIVGSYCIAGRRVECDGLAYPSPVVSGREIGRKTLLDEYYLFWSPSCLLIRSDLIRHRRPFYDSTYLHADVDVLYELLRDADFGFVHQVLTYIRVHEESMTARDSRKINTQLLSHLQLLLKFGPVYLSEDEYRDRSAQLFDKYYNALAVSVFEMKRSDFWKYQKSELKKLGHPLDGFKLFATVLGKMLFRPREAARHMKAAMLAKSSAPKP